MLPVLYNKERKNNMSDEKMYLKKKKKLFRCIFCTHYHIEYFQKIRHVSSFNKYIYVYFFLYNKYMENTHEEK